MKSHYLTPLQLKHYNRQAHLWVFNTIDILIPKTLFYLHNIYLNTKLRMHMTDNWDCHSYFTNEQWRSDGGRGAARPGCHSLGGDTQSIDQYLY